MLKRIFAVVSEKDFYAIQRRVKVEGINLGQAFAALVHTYAIGQGPALEPYEAQDENSRPRLSDVEQ